MKSLFAMLLFFVFIVPVFAHERFEHDAVIARITVENDEDVLRVVRLGLDLLEQREGKDLFILTTREQMESLRKQGWRVSVDEEQTRLLHRPLMETFRDGYRTIPEMKSFLQDKAARYPNLAEYFIYGSSWERITGGPTAGSELFGIKLTNRQITGTKPALFIMSAIHSRELATSEIAMRFVDYLLTNYGFDADATWLLDAHQIIIIPSANPDGRRLAEQSLFQRKNMNTSYGGNCANPPTSSSQFGVDLNRNFNFKWGLINAPTEPLCGQTYPGPTAASEPETAAIQNLVSSIFPDQRGPGDTDPAPQNATGVFIDIHSYSNLVMWPWGFTNTTPPNNAELVFIGRKMASYSGYTPQQSIQLYATSGSTKDWAYGELGVAAYGFEIGPSSGTCGGFFPPFSCLDTGADGSFWSKNLPSLLYAARIARTPYMLANGPNIETISLARTGQNTYELQAQANEVLNGNQNIAAAEYYVDTPPWNGGTPNAMTALDGSFNSPIETARASVTTTEGRHIVYVRSRDANNNWGPVRAVFTPRRNVNADFDGDAKTDISVFRPGNGVWYITNSSNNTLRFTSFGLNGDRIVPSDYDGDGKTDVAVFRPSSNVWYILRSSDNNFTATQFGLSADIPAPGDFDGDGRADITVFRPSSGIWYVLRSFDGGFSATPFGVNNDAPVVGDYDNDGKSDIAVWRPSSGVWYSLRSRDGFSAISFGLNGDKPVASDFDGDGKTDFGIFRPSSGVWYLLQSTNGFTALQFGISEDKPVAGDYDGDGKADIAVFRPSSGTWYLLRSSAGFTALNWGVSTDIAVPNAFVP
jgi:hypothetical protein